MPLKSQLISVNFDLTRTKGQMSLLGSTRKVNKIVTAISRRILTARAIDVTKLSINDDSARDKVPHANTHVFNLSQLKEV